MFGKKGSLARLLWLAYSAGRLDERNTRFSHPTPPKPSPSWWQNAKTGFETFRRTHLPTPTEGE